MRFSVILALLLVLSGCGRKTPAKIIVPPLPNVEIADVPSPPTPTIIVAKGSTLQSIATAAYHHRDFSGFVGHLNGITIPERLRAGATLKTPSLPVAFRDAGLHPQYQPAINALAQAWIDLVDILPAYTHARDASGVNEGSSFTVPADIKARLISCADAIDASIDVLMHPATGHAVPLRTIGQFAGVSHFLREFSTGLVASRDYDTFLAEKGFGLGFTYALLWVQSGYK